MTTENRGQRFTDVPFGIIRDNSGQVVDRGQGTLTKAQQTEIDARNYAWRVFNQTGDKSYLRALGVLPTEDE